MSDIKGGDVNKLLKSSPRISKISHPQSLVLGQTEQRICRWMPQLPLSKPRQCAGKREPAGNMRPCPSLLRLPTSAENRLGVGAGMVSRCWGPVPRESNQNHPDPQPRILHFHEAPPSVMMTQNHIFENNALTPSPNWEMAWANHLWLWSLMLLWKKKVSMPSLKFSSSPTC